MGTPRRVSSSISWNSPGVEDHSRCNEVHHAGAKTRTGGGWVAYFSPPMRTECRRWRRRSIGTTTSAFSVRKSTILPLPSSPTLQADDAGVAFQKRGHGGYAFRACTSGACRVLPEFLLAVRIVGPGAKVRVAGRGCQGELLFWPSGGRSAIAIDPESATKERRSRAGSRRPFVAPFKEEVVIKDEHGPALDGRSANRTHPGANAGQPTSHPSPLHNPTQRRPASPRSPPGGKRGAASGSGIARPGGDGAGVPRTEDTMLRRHVA